MSFTVLSDSTRAQLKQERDRLVQERKSIIQSVVTETTAEIDQTLLHLSALLEDTANLISVASASPPTAATQTSSTRSTLGKSPRGTRQAQPKAAAAAPQQIKSSGKSATLAAAKGVKTAKTTPAFQSASNGSIGSVSPLDRFDPKRLKAQFQGQAPQAAIMKIFQDSPNQAFSQDDLINQLYDEFPPQDLIRARRSVSLTLMWSTKRGELVRVQEDPALYQLKGKR